MFPPDDAQPAAQEEPLQVVTAFLVFQTKDGIWTAHPDITKPVIMERQSHLGDYTAACAVVMKDVAAMETVNRQMLHAAQLGQQMRAAQEAQRLGLGGPGVPGTSGPQRRMGVERPL